ncbi:hypothetical protein EJ06DRAFT_526707 [Trichodelitschia bisporula]|uniref:Myb-like DNA-binding domain-containing protein n=1 Tax=Trichodelitschia bisporula TaxID=703511 RepID=A0A6G1I934_9PEZI|nr:hypothetical protein EJ06DRAFT_526707 [Trichodelitschia bisporula]
MAPSTNPTPAYDVVGYLLSCLRHAESGRVNFDAVAKELNIGKAAAAKRWECLLKAHGINPAVCRGGGPIRPKSSGTPPPKEEGLPSPQATPKKKAAPKRTRAGNKRKRATPEDTDIDVKLGSSNDDASVEKRKKVSESTEEDKAELGEAVDEGAVEKVENA